jgi:hypothetical protein
MRKSVVLLDGPVGVGKSTLGRAAASQLDFGFIDGDDFSRPGHWLRSILQNSRAIVSASEESLRTYPAVIVAYPLRCTNWIFFRQSFARIGVACHCIGLIADLTSITARTRSLGEEEIARSAEMIAQGYGQRAFSDVIVRTDKADFDETCQQLIKIIRRLS